MNFDNVQYQPTSPYVDKTGYCHNLTHDQQTSLDEIYQWINNEHIHFEDLSTSVQSESLLILRYLRANSFNCEKTKNHLLLNLHWRKEHNVKELITLDPDDILGCRLSDLIEVFPHWHCGYDKFGRPVIYKQYGGFETEVIKSISTFEAVSKYHIWEQEMCQLLCSEQTKKLGYVVETITGVIDVEGMQLRQITRDFLALVKAIANIDQAQYPETLGQCFIINTPSSFPFIWRIVKPWLDPVVASKIKIFGANREEWIQAFSDDIGLENVPSNYGGKLPALDKSVHPYHEVLSILAQRQVTRSNECICDILHDNVSIAESSLGTSDFKDARDESNLSDEFEFLRCMSIDDLPSTYTLEQSTVSISNYYFTFYDVVVASLSKFVRPLFLLYKKIIPRYFLLQSSELLSAWLLRTIAFFTLILLTSIGMSAYALGNMYWNTIVVVKQQMWIGVMTLSFCSLLLLMNFAGFIGLKTKNRPLLIVFSSCLAFFFILFFPIGIACILYASGNPEINHALENLSSRDKAQVKTLLIEYNIILGTVCIVLSLFSWLPLLVSLALTEKLDKEQRQDIGDDSSVVANIRSEIIRFQQIRIVTRIAQVISLLMASIMIGYGGHSLLFLLSIQFDYPVFAFYLILFGGVTVLLGAVFGIWVSYTSMAIVVRLYHCFILPTMIIVVTISLVFSFAFLADLPLQTSLVYSSLLIDDNYTEESLVTFIQIRLLVGGVLALTAGLFQLVCLSSSRGLYSILLLFEDFKFSVLTKCEILLGKGIPLAQIQHPNILGSELDVLSDESFLDIEKFEPLTFMEKFSLMWGFLAGLAYIYVSSSFVIFAQRIKNKQRCSIWIVALWRLLGKFDRRYQNADSYFVSVYGLLAILIGPLLLVYGSSVLGRLKFRPIVGLICSSVELYSQTLYFALLISNQFSSISTENAAVFVIMFIVLNFVKIVAPVLVGCSESKVIFEKLTQLPHLNHQKLEKVKEVPIDRGNEMNIAHYVANKHRRLKTFTVV